MRCLICAGGTGGHIYPAITIAKKLIKEENADILYIGRNNSLEEELAKRADLKFQGIDMLRIPKMKIKDSYKFIRGFLASLRESRKALRNFKPDLVIGTGGYVCGPILYEAQRLKYKNAVFELNIHPGITTRLIMKKADLIMIAAKSGEQEFKKAKNIKVVGIPVREEFYSDEKPEKLFSNNMKTVLSFGGSGGQKTINENIIKMLIKYYKDMNFNIVHVSGKYAYDWCIKSLEDEGIDPFSDRVQIRDYIHNMPFVLKAADLVITGAGAITLSELCAAEKASIIIPKAYVVENHQEYNARYFSENGAAELIFEKDINEELLYEKISSLIVDDDKLKDMERKVRGLYAENSIDLIYKEIINIVDR